MKQALTFSTLCLLVTSTFAQAPQTTPFATRDAFDRDPLVVPASRQPQNSTEVYEMISEVRKEIQSRVQQDKSKSSPTLTDADYHKLISKADECFFQGNYDNALLLYNGVLDYRTDQYASDRIEEINALKAFQYKMDTQRKKDEILKAEAEFASKATFGRHIVHFTGGVMSDSSLFDLGTSKAYNLEDMYSSFLSIGKYDTAATAIKTACNFSLDGIAIPADTRLIVYKELNCQGMVLLDVTGPAIINNYLWEYDPLYRETDTRDFAPELQLFFPPETRSWSKSNMHRWEEGSFEIKAVE